MFKSIRHAFNREFNRLQALARMPKGVQFPDIFESNLERAARLAALDAAMTAALQATKSAHDARLAHELALHTLEKAGLKYVPALKSKYNPKITLLQPTAYLAEDREYEAFLAYETKRAMDFDPFEPEEEFIAAEIERLEADLGVTA